MRMLPGFLQISTRLIYARHASSLFGCSLSARSVETRLLRTTSHHALPTQVPASSSIACAACIVSPRQTPTTLLTSARSSVHQPHRDTDEEPSPLNPPRTHLRTPCHCARHSVRVNQKLRRTGRCLLGGSISDRFDRPPARAPETIKKKKNVSREDRDAAGPNLPPVRVVRDLQAEGPTHGQRRPQQRQRRSPLADARVRRPAFFSGRGGGGAREI